ncbi:MAG TPA: hypothetical protein VN416_10130 [Desulfomonilia bacterium]|jgi:hypothetical protein|nr:hypothetical protein [Thermodesulfobacteriota bacterium]HWR69370.1 hypothetical protein [Desulfomonilia bacterium]
MVTNEEPKEPKDAVYYFKCEKCASEIFWSEIRPSVQRAARVFKWVRAGCPNDECDHHLTLSAPDRMYDRQEAKRLFEDMKGRGLKVYWV